MDRLQVIAICRRRSLILPQSGFHAFNLEPRAKARGLCESRTAWRRADDRNAGPRAESLVSQPKPTQGKMQALPIARRIQHRCELLPQWNGQRGIQHRHAGPLFRFHLSRRFGPFPLFASGALTLPMLVGFRDKPGNLPPVNLVDSDIKATAIGGPTLIKLDLSASQFRLLLVIAFRPCLAGGG